MDLEIYDETNGQVSEDQKKLIKNVLDFAAKKIGLKANTEMSVTMVKNDRIQEINRDYRKVDRATDVISFAIEDENDDEFPVMMSDEMKAEIPENIGDIFVSIDKVNEQADFLGHSVDRELGFLIVHGFLHLNGYDHMKPEDEKVMFDLQRKILNEYGLKK
ncbi:rRNA maturation RNase YbeY [Fructilactobacillus sanfranciscensis]|uniref:rRNA maturation RNase YbeY n=1 Tax=Fructilactobacillus sanfranciscensis TaxID=1625 RepID=UPI0006EEB476|nr:rRNA maturation RNase YbeY [Fructilactobacillus sanfranciscensis]KRM80780.1 metalloprotease [Fructilactobacillus sanfranciscensis DSM 20451]MCG7194340.1 rRNA maturation RNase YbeY [Fructilactobacillus sanfranciscensis]MCG7195651.1 rRNA maturation RNase YbeY [Fructilactobacillus sanfranciscensis]MVF15044.1 rRNA maturation RNase YbeY [Fructilactobacillus sanfranciscensis]NDR59871.1 rRNA maturation RNase YbeY [Fructilactobacillus sanfranciscensis]